MKTYKEYCSDKELYGPYMFTGLFIDYCGTTARCTNCWTLKISHMNPKLFTSIPEGSKFIIVGKPDDPLFPVIEIIV